MRRVPRVLLPAGALALLLAISACGVTQWFTGEPTRAEQREARQEARREARLARQGGASSTEAQPFEAQPFDVQPSGVAPIDVGAFDGPRGPAAAGLEARSLSVGGLDRQYLAYVPQNLPPGAAAPLVVAFHGGGGEAGGFAQRTGLLDMAERHGFVLVLPEGVGGSWATGGGVGRADRTGVDDLAFVDALLDEAAATLPVEPGRAYATGLSAGGMMSYRAACELPGRFRAIAVVAGTLAAPTCSGGQAVSLLHIHGTDDENVPLEGGAGAMSSRRANYPSVYEALDLFRARNGCGGDAATSPAQDTRCETASCDAGGEVRFCLVERGGHAWPGADSTRRQEQNDVYVSPYFNATDYIARFFLSH